MKRVGSVVLCALWLALGCAVGPEYQRPAAPLPRAAQYREGWKRATPSDAVLRGKWWQVFAEPELDALEERLLVDNQTIQQFVAQYAAARAQIRVVRAGELPVASVSPSASVSRSSGNTGGFGGGRRVTTYQLPLEASWAPDLFGKVQNSVRAAQYGAQVSAAELEGQKLLAQSALAQSYFALRGQDALQELLDATVAADEQILEATRALYTTGIGTQLAVAQAEQTLLAVRVQVSTAGIQRAQLEHAIATLLGVSATDFSIPKRAALPQPPVIPAGAPSALLERRPDIAAAERQMAQANAQIGVGYAAYYPTLTLSASGGFASTALGTLLSWPSRVWALGASATELLFDGGARSAQIDQYRASYDASVASYRQTVLVAFQQVEDYLSQSRILAQAVEQQQAAVAAAQSAFDAQKVRYDTGIDPYLDLMTEQTLLLEARQSLVGLQVQQMTAAVLLVEALGGGWHAADLPAPG
ncbi:MAG: efflux transporter outer membrane subunit [Polyangiaceae bacterium]